MNPAHKRSAPGGTIRHLSTARSATGGTSGGTHPQRAAVAATLDAAHKHVTNPNMKAHPLTEGEKAHLMNTATSLQVAASAPAG